MSMRELWRQVLGVRADGALELVRRRVALASVMMSVGMVPMSERVTYDVFALCEGQPTGGHGVTARVSLTVRDSTVGYVVHELTRQARMQVVYDNTNPLIAKRVSVRVGDMLVMNALTVALKGTGLEAKLESDGETVVVRPVTVAAVTKQGRGIIVGRVTDSTTGRGLGGAQVRVEGVPKLTAVSSDSGNFTLRDVPPGNQVLLIRLFGYRPAERTVTVVDSDRTTVWVAMVPVPTVLSGVVTTATGVQRKVEVGNDITTLKVDSIMQVAPVASVTDLLETRVPGLTVLHSSGVPGNPSRIRLRGVSSIIGNNDPIVVVDGIRVYANQSDPRNANLAPSHTGGGDQSPNGYAAPSPLDQIDPASIETIEVFKGPSASALYGSDAANGVIVITTRHGRAGPTHWNLILGDGVNWLPGNWPTHYYRFGKEQSLYLEQNTDTISHPCVWNDLRCVVDSLVPFQALNDPLYSVFSHGSDQTAALTVSGGVPTLQYSLSGSTAGDVGNLKLPAIEQQRYDHFYGTIPSYLVRPDHFTTWGVNGSLTTQPTPAMRVTLQSSLFNSMQQQGSLQQAITQLEGEYIHNGGVLPFVYETGVSNAYGGDTLTSTPLIQNDVERATDDQLTSTNVLTLTWQPYTWLPLTTTGGFNTIQRTDQTYIPYGINYTGPGSALADTTGFYGLGHGTSHNQTLTVGTAIPLFRQRMTLALGGNVYTTSTSDFSVFTNQLAPGVSIPTSFNNCVQGSGNQPVCTPSASSQATSGQSTYGWYVEPRFNFASRFFVAPGFRLDGGSSSGSQVSTTVGGVKIPGLSGFPKIDFSYLAVDRQGGAPLWGVLTLLRPRVAFGLAGTQPSPQSKLRLFSDTASVLNSSTVVPSITLSSLGNTQLRPESSRELEGGFDAALWHGRLSMTWTQYNKTRYNALLNIPVAPSVFGLNGSYQVNIGEVRNTGRELTVNIQPIESRMVSWTVGANLSNDNNLVVRLAPSFLPNKNLGIVAGYPLFGIWEKPIVSFADLNHNGIVEPSEVLIGDSLGYVGTPEPRCQANLNTGLTLLNGRLSVNATFAYQNGMTQNNLAVVNSGAVNFIANVPGTSLATQAAITAATCGSQCIQGPFGRGTDIGFFQTVNTFRFNNLSISYALPKGVSSWFHIPTASLALQGANLALHTNYRGIDPNVNAFSTVSSGDETADLGQIPQPRIWWLKLTLGD